LGRRRPDPDLARVEPRLDTGACRTAGDEIDLGEPGLLVVALLQREELTGELDVLDPRQLDRNRSELGSVPELRRKTPTSRFRRMR